MTSAMCASLLVLRGPRRAVKIPPMSGSEPTFRIDPIEPAAVGPRFTALIDRLEPTSPGEST